MCGKSGNAGGEAEANVSEPAQLLHHGIYPPGVRSLRVEDGFGVIEDKDHLLRRQGWSQRGQIRRVLDACPDDLGKSAEEVNTRRLDLVATDKSPIVAKSFFDEMVVEESESDRRFSDPRCTDESEGFELLSESNKLLNHAVTSKTVPWRRGW